MPQKFNRFTTFSQRYKYHFSYMHATTFSIPPLFIFRMHSARSKIASGPSTQRNDWNASRVYIPSILSSRTTARPGGAYPILLSRVYRDLSFTMSQSLVHYAPYPQDEVPSHSLEHGSPGISQSLGRRVCAGPDPDMDALTDVYERASHSIVFKWNLS